MARLRFIANPGGLSTHTARKTLIQLLAPSDQKTLIQTFGVGFQGVTSTDIPVLIELARQTDAGTPGGDGGALTLIKHNSQDGETFRTTAQKGRSDSAAWTANPTTTDVLWRFPCHPQSGVVYGPPPGWEYLANEGERIGLLVTAAVAITAVAFINGEE